MSKDGGPAFPHPDYLACGAKGMTLRDYFAAKALAGSLPLAKMYSDELGRTGSKTSLSEFMAAMAYHYADAMLKAREA